jgi:hypothetical protein
VVEQLPSTRLSERSRDVLPDEVYNRRWMERIQRNIAASEGGCWLWTGRTYPNGYGQTTYRGKVTRVHRKVYELHYGVTLDRWVYVCHSCDVKLCCDPAHLWPGTSKDNSVDAVRKGRHQGQLKTHCPQGHEFTPENTYYKPDYNGNGIKSRACKECNRIRMRSPEYRLKANERQRRRRAQNRGASL